MSGWAEKPWRPWPLGPADDAPAPGGLWMADMPVGRPRWGPPHIKGVPEATPEGDGTWDEDYRPGGGLPWQPV